MTKANYHFSVIQRGKAWSIVGRKPLVSRTATGGLRVNFSPWASAPPREHIFATYATRDEALYSLGRLEERLARFDAN